MSLAVVIDYLVARLGDQLDASTTVSDESAESDHLPAVSLELSQVTDRLVGIGRIPRGTRVGALEISLSVDLANPVLDLGGGETLDLVSGDRLTLVIPHGPLVKADGSQVGSFRASDLSVRDSGAWTVVGKAPSGKQVQPDPVGGLLRFGQPLPTTGTLTISYRIGAWDVVVSRFQGVLTVIVTADRDTLPALSRRVAEVLDAPDAVLRLSPVAWGSRTDAASPDLPATVRSQTMGYSFDAEFERPLLTSGGGVITRIAVTLHFENGENKTETFDVVTPS